MRLHAERQAVVDAARRMTDAGLVVNTAGNVSVLAGDTVVITPSSLAYDTLRAADVCLVDLASGETEPGMLHPSSELPLHLAVYRAQRARAIVHTHSLYATALTTVRDHLPAIHYQIVDLGGTVPVLPYATFGSDALARLYHQAALLGVPAILDDPELARVQAAQRAHAEARDASLARRAKKD